MTTWKPDYVSCKDGLLPYTLDEVLEAFEPGWHDLIKRAFAALPEGAAIIQVKQKFGGLRIYAAAPEQVDMTAFYACVEGLMDEAERLCEVCGSSDGVQRGHGGDDGAGMIRNLCVSCRDAVPDRLDGLRVLEGDPNARLPYFDVATLLSTNDPLV